MNKPTDSHKEPTQTSKPGEAVGPQASPAPASSTKAWPFAPGSQLGKQVARPWTPKPAYRFNQR